MKTTTMRITAIATTAILSLAGAFWAGSQSADTEYKTKTVTKTVIDPVDHCLAGTLKNYGLAYSVIDECKNLSDAQRSEASEIAESFVDALFAETYEG